MGGPPSEGAGGGPGDKPRPPKGKGGGAPVGPVTMLDLASPGPFELVLPRGLDGKLAALCDEDRDGYIRPESDKLSEPVLLGVLDEEQEGIVLTLIAPPAMGAGGGPDGAGGPGGPPGDADGAAAPRPPGL